MSLLVPGIRLNEVNNMHPESNFILLTVDGKPVMVHALKAIQDIIANSLEGTTIQLEEASDSRVGNNGTYGPVKTLGTSGGHIWRWQPMSDNIALGLGKLQLSPFGHDCGRALA